MIVVPLKSLCQIRHGGTPSKANAAFWDGAIPWVSPKDMKSSVLSDSSDHITQEAINDSAASVVPEQSILVVVRSGILAHSFPVAQAAKPLSFNQDIKGLTPDSTKVDPDYLYWFVRSQEPRVLAQGVKKGATVHSVQSGFIENLQVPLPERIEQRRIVDLLSRAEGIVRLRREAEKKAAELIPALFIDMFGDPATNPKGWPTASIGDLFEVKGGKRLPKGAPYAEEPTAFRYIRGTDIWPDQINTQSLVYLRPEDQATIKRYVVAKGDVVITIAGKIGVVAPVGDDLVGVNLTENAAMIRPHGTESTNAAFLSSMLNSRFVQRQIETLTGRVTIGKLALERIRFLKILLPALSLQAEYVQRIEQIRAIQSQQSSATAKAQATFDALLARVFKTPSTNY